MTKLLMRLDEVGEITTLGKTKIFELIKSGQLPVVKIGKRTLVRCSDLEAFIEAHTQRAA